MYYKKLFHKRSREHCVRGLLVPSPSRSFPLRTSSVLCICVYDCFSVSWVGAGGGVESFIEVLLIPSLLVTSWPSRSKPGSELEGWEIDLDMDYKTILWQWCQNYVFTKCFAYIYIAFFTCSWDSYDQDLEGFQLISPVNLTFFLLHSQLLFCCEFQLTSIWLFHHIHCIGSLPTSEILAFCYAYKNYGMICELGHCMWWHLFLCWFHLKDARGLSDHWGFL